MAPRLSVLLARDSPVGVIFRRGPSKRVRLVIWNRADDTFEFGQWFTGRIYTDRSDVSPDGRHLLYFAMGGLAWAIPETGGTWTAISTLPSLTADALWGQGNTWGGGGVFLSNDSVCLENNTFSKLIRNESGLRNMSHRILRPPDRLCRDGWLAKGGPVYEKNLPEGWVLRRMGWSGGYQLEHEAHGLRAMAEWEWADWDRHRLAWTEAGCLWAASVGVSGPETAKTLYDFNDGG